MINRTCSFTLLLSPFQGDKRLLEKHRERMRSFTHSWSVCMCTERADHWSASTLSFPDLLSSSAHYSFCRPPAQNKNHQTQERGSFHSQSRKRTPWTDHTPLHYKDHHKTPRLLASFLKNASATLTENTVVLWSGIMGIPYFWKKFLMLSND